MATARIMEKLAIHQKCRNSVYPKTSNIIRAQVPDDKVPWSVIWSDYSPITWTSPLLKNKPWADPPLEDQTFKPKWNLLDETVNRKSHFAHYQIQQNGLPINPMGRTGIQGRGCLGRWGPNHAADSILTKWKRNPEKGIQHHPTTQKPILQFVAIERKDCHEWAVPGGMVDPGETVASALKREFLEEALNILSVSDEEKERKKKMVEEYFSCGMEIYRGYVDDPRNTDNAWMETVATNFHDDSGSFADQLELSAGDDALNAQWMDVDSNLRLYASHKDFITEVARIRDCHW